MYQTWMYTCVLAIGGIDFASIWNYSDGVVIPEVFFFILNSFFQLVYLLGN